jgi:hypothetical protein
MKAVGLHAYREPLTVDEVVEPEVTEPFDVVMLVFGTELCRTDLRIRDRWFTGVVPAELP